MHVLVLVLVALLVTACSCTTVDPMPDAGVADAGGADAGLEDAAEPDATAPPADAGLRPFERGDESPLTPPFPGGFHLARSSSIAFSGRSYLVAYGHTPASATCQSCGVPRLRGVLLDASFEPVERYGFPIAEDVAWPTGPVRALALDEGFAVGYSTRDGALEIALLRGGDGRVSARARRPGAGGFDLATDGRDVLAVWTQGDAIVAGRVSGGLAGDELLEAGVTLCEGRCTVPRATFDGTRFVVSYTTEAGAHEARSLEIAGDGSLALGWHREIVPARTAPAEQLEAWGLPVATAASGDTFLASWDEPAETGGEHRLVAQRFRTSDGAPIDPAPVLIRTAPAFVSVLNLSGRERDPDGIAARAVVPTTDGFALLVRRVDEVGVGTGIAITTGELIHLRPSDVALVADDPIRLTGELAPLRSTEMAGLGAAWDGARLTAIWEEEGIGALRHARVALSDTDVHALPFGDRVAPQGSPLAAVAGDRALVAFRGTEVDPGGTFIPRLHAVRVDGEAAPLDAEPRLITTLAWYPSLAAGAGTFLAAWVSDPLVGEAVIRAARVSPSGELLGELVLDDAATGTGQIEPGEIATAFADGRFLVAWARVEDTGSGARSVEIASIDPASGEVIDRFTVDDLRIGRVTSAGGRIVVIGSEGELVVQTDESFEVGASICQEGRPCSPVGLSVHDGTVLALMRVSAGVVELEAVEIDVAARAPGRRVPLPSMVCDGDTRRCDYELVADGASFHAVLRNSDASVWLTSVSGASLEPGERLAIAASDEAWGDLSVAALGPGRLLFAYERVDLELDARRSMVRAVDLRSL